MIHDLREKPWPLFRLIYVLNIGKKNIKGNGLGTSKSEIPKFQKG
jgi:hypothetical protein